MYANEKIEWDEFSVSDYLDWIGVDYKVTHGTSGEQLNLKECPVCGDTRSKVYIGSETGLGNCFVCGERFNNFTLVKSFNGLLTAKQVFEHVRLFLNEQGWRPKRSKHRAVSHNQGQLQLPENVPAKDHPYLINRGVENYLISYFDLRYCEQGSYYYIDSDGDFKTQRFDERIIVPVYDLNGELKSYQGRDVTGTSDRKYLFPKGYASTGALLYNAYNVLGSKRIVLNEGVFDVVGTKRALDTVNALRNIGIVGSFGKALTLPKFNRNKDQLSALFEMRAHGLQEVVFMWDGEHDAVKSAIKHAAKLTQYGIKSFVAMLPKGKDPGDANPDDVVKAYYGAEPVTLGSVARLQFKALRKYS